MLDRFLGDMGTEVWPGESMSSVSSRSTHQNGQFLAEADETDSSNSNSESSSDLSSEEDEVPETTIPLHDGNKTKKRVTFRSDEDLEEIFEIPARGDDLFDEICAVIEQLPVSRDSTETTELESDLKISGRAAGCATNQYTNADKIISRDTKADKLPRPERPDRALLYRRNTDVWGTYTVTHANTPANSSTGSTDAKTPKTTLQNRPRNTSYQTRSTTPPEAKLSSAIPPKPPVPVQRRNTRSKSANRSKKKTAKTAKDSKNTAKGNNGGEDIADGEKLIAMFLEKNINREDTCDGEKLPSKSPKPRTTRKGTVRRTVASARNREKELINKEMKGEVQRKVYRNYNNISSLHKPGTRNVGLRQTQSDSSEKRNTGDKTRLKTANKHNLSVDNEKLNSGPKVRVGHVRQGSADSTASLDNSGKTEKEQRSNVQLCANVSNEVQSPTTKSNGFIFPAEKSFHFPLMTPPKETTSQLVRLDTNMLSLYKKKLYAWHMANGTVAEGRIETPCISPMWEPVKLSYS